MTEPNKELPKEVVEKIRQSAIHEVGGDYEGGANGIIKDGIIQRKTEGAEIAQSHYAPIIEAKDKQLSEKDATISKLMGLLKECYIKTRDGRALGVKMAITWAMSQEAGYDKAFECYCKENGIDLGESKRKKY